MNRRALLAILAAVSAAVPASAQVVTLDAVDSGFYEWTGDHSPSNQNYIAGNIGNSYGEFRDFVVFDLSGVTAPITEARLELYNPGQVPDGGDGYFSADPTETYVAYEVVTPVATLVAGGTGLTTVFDDLGGGVVLGSVDVSAADNGTVVQVPLNADALSALNGADGLWAVGGTLDTMTGARKEYVFGRSNGGHVRRLVLTSGATVFADGFESGSSSGWSAVVP